MDFPYGETVTRLRGTPSTNAYNASEINWTSPDSLDLTGCAVWSGTTAEPSIDARNLVLSDFIVAAEFGADVTPQDRLVIRGKTCKVVGRPFDWSSPFSGWAPGTIIQASLVEG